MDHSSAAKGKRTMGLLRFIREVADEARDPVVVERDRYRAALERIRDEKERVPVLHKTGVAGHPRFVHPVRSRVIAENALKEGAVT